MVMSFSIVHESRNIRRRGTYNKDFCIVCIVCIVLGSHQGGTSTNTRQFESLFFLIFFLMWIPNSKLQNEKKKKLDRVIRILSVKHAFTKNPILTSIAWQNIKNSYRKFTVTSIIIYYMFCFVFSVVIKCDR